jgi:4-alpha-glucanotransferase
MGLRSLSPEDPAYVPHYEGGPWQRDGAYHQGTVWSWLLGPYAIAHQRVFGDADKALAILEQIAPHLADACVGSISEIFDAAPPHAPRGCFAQAWSVAELLRAWHALDAQRAEQHTRNIRHG